MVMLRALIDGLDSGMVTHAEFIKWVDQILGPGETESVLIPNLLDSIKIYSALVAQIYAEHYSPDDPNALEPRWRDCLSELSTYILKYTGRLREMLIYYGG
jgi:hypothetical protein